MPGRSSGLPTRTACWALSRGRGVSILGGMALAGLGLLIWRPGDLFGPGFQLSFGVVTGLVLFVGRVGDWMLSEV